MTTQKTIRQASDLAGLNSRHLGTVNRAAVNQEERTVELAWASEAPVSRWYGKEVLEISKKAIRQERLASGCPLLVGHDANDHVGVVESVTIDRDRVARAVVRFGRSARAEEIFQDVIDGIRQNVSVGYMIHSAIEEKDGNNTNYRVTDWEPYEMSIVSMPADISVGVGRTLDPEQPTTEEPTMEERKVEAPGVDLAAIEKQAREAEMKRSADIVTLCREFDGRLAADFASRMIAEGKSLDQVRGAILDELKKDAPKPVAPEADTRQTRIEVGLRYDQKSLQPFGQGQPAEERAYRAGKWAQAVIFGNPEAERWCKDHGINTRVMTESTGSAGGYLVPTELESAVIDLRALYGVTRRLCRIVPMGSASVEIPKRGSGTTAYFAGENTATTESDMAWNQVQLVPKELSALTRISMSLAEDAVIDLAAWIADEHAYAFAVKEDACLIDGDGTSTYGGMVGLKSLLETASMAGGYTAATNTDTPAEVIAAELSAVMAKLPSYARVGALWLASPAFDEMVFGRLMAAAGGNNTTTLAGEITAAYLGKPRVVCETCYSNLTADLTGKAMLFYGNFKQGVAVGDRRGITVQVLRERYAEYRQVGILATERVDINCHGVGDTTTAGSICALIGG